MFTTGFELLIRLRELRLAQSIKAHNSYLESAVEAAVGTGPLRMDVER